MKGQEYSFKGGYGFLVVLFMLCLGIAIENIWVCLLCEGIVLFTGFIMYEVDKINKLNKELKQGDKK